MKPKRDPKDLAMSYTDDWRRALLNAPDLSARAKLLGVVLAQHANWQTGSDAYPSNNTIAAMMSSSVRTVKYARGELISAGWITVDDGCGPGGTSRHTLLIPHGKVCEGVQNMHPPVQNMPGGGAKYAPKLSHDPISRTHQKNKRERAGAQSRSATHEQTREADALPSPSEQIGPEQQASELVTAEDASTVQAEVAPPVTGQALMGEGHSKASDTPELPEDMRRLRDELRAGREALAERDRHVASLPGPDVYLAELRELITVEHDLLWRSESAWHQLINNARRDGWTPAQLTERVHWCVVHYATARKAWRPQWLLSDVGRYDEGTAHVLNKAEAQHQRRVIESEGYLGQGQRRHAADLNDVGL